MIEKIKTTFSSEKIKKHISLIIFSLFFVLIIHKTGFAEDTTTPTTTNSLDYLIQALGLLIGMISSIIGGLSAIISILLDPSITNGTLFNLSTYLRQIWVLVSNVVYLIFAGILITISFMNIIGKGNGDTFELKKALPRLIVGILLVPLSWFIVQFILSLSSILTVSVFSLPFDTFKNSITSLNETQKNWCTERVINVQDSNTTSTFTSSSTGSSGSGFLYCGKKEDLTTLEILTGVSKDSSGGNTYKLSGLISYYTFGIMELGEVDKIKIGNLQHITDLFKLSAKVIFDIIFIVVYLFLLMALFLALFTRVSRIWLYTIFSPVFGLAFFLSKSKMSDKFKDINLGKFISLAFVPVYVSAALSFGLLFLLIIGKGLGAEQAKSNLGDNASFPLGITTLKIVGSVGDSTNQDSIIKTILGGSLGAIGFIILKMFGLAFLWFAVMSALHGSEITQKAIEPIETLGKQVGDFAKKSPQYIPIPGTGKLGLGSQNIGSLAKGLNDGIGKLNSQQQYNKSTEISKLFDKEGVEKESEALERFRNITKSSADGIKKFQEALSKTSPDTIAKNKNLREVIAQKASDLNIKDYNKILSADTQERVFETFDNMKTTDNEKLIPNGENARDFIGKNGDGNNNKQNNNQNNGSGGTSQNTSTTTPSTLNFPKIISDTNNLNGTGLVKDGNNIKINNYTEFAEHIYNQLKDKYKGNITESELNNILIKEEHIEDGSGDNTITNVIGKLKTENKYKDLLKPTQG